MRWFALLLLFGAAATSAQERPAVVVTRPGASAYKVAIQQFAPGSGGVRVEPLRGALSDALEFSGLFESLDPAAFLGPRVTTSFESQIPCPDWRQIGADALVEGRVDERSGDELLVEFRVWDVARCRRLLRKRYRGGPGDERRIGHLIADDVVEAFTGRRGIASTEIGFVSTRKGHAEIHVMDADGARVRAATANRTINAFPDWSPDGLALLYMSYQYRRSPHLFLISRGGRYQPGRMLRSLDPTRSVYRGVFDPKGLRIAAVVSVDGAPEIYVVDVDGQNPRRLTRNGAIDVSPSWSPDGGRMAFVSDRTGSPQIYLMNSDGSGVQRLTFDGGYNTAPSWSPDGRWIAYEARVQGQFDIWLIDPETRTNAPLVTHPRSDENPTWSPDSRHLAFHSTRRGPADIYIVGVDGKNLRRITHGEGENTSPDWGPYPR